MRIKFPPMYYEYDERTICHTCYKDITGASLMEHYIKEHSMIQEPVKKIAK